MYTQNVNEIKIDCLTTVDSIEHDVFKHEESCRVRVKTNGSNAFTQQVGVVIYKEVVSAKQIRVSVFFQEANFAHHTLLTNK